MQWPPHYWLEWIESHVQFQNSTFGPVRLRLRSRLLMLQVESCSHSLIWTLWWRYFKLRFISAAVYGGLIILSCFTFPQFLTYELLHLGCKMVLNVLLIIGMSIQIFKHDEAWTYIWTSLLIILCINHKNGIFTQKVRMRVFGGGGEDVGNLLSPLYIFCIGIIIIFNLCDP
jgi:hypothetical protein